ncbi:MAG: hypothetical protein GKR95_20395 [Gammaproteobacteria bacterium]|nr:hypothetical protein [Gammaproteobacteria bacterium]
MRDPAQGALANVIQEADCLVYLGKPIDFTSGFGLHTAESAREFIVITDDGKIQQRAQECSHEKPLLSVPLSPVKAVTSILGYLAAENDRDFSSKESPGDNSRIRWCEFVENALAHRELASHDSSSLYSKNVVQCVQEALHELPDSILVCDGGEFGQWSQAFASSETRLTNGPGGAIGGGLPYAIGAKIGRPDATVIAFMGDGTVGFHLAEFETASRENVDITVVIGNDSRWNAEHHIQTRDYGLGRTHGCGLGDNIRYDIVAKGLGCEGVFAETIDELRQGLKLSQRSGRPTCLNVIIPGAPAPVYKEFDFEESS